MERTVYVEAPSRLHFGFVETSDEGYLRGSAGVALDCPLLRFRLTTSGKRIGPCSHSQELSSIAKRCMGDEHHGVAAEVYEHIPKHVGLGSGTQMCLSSGKAAALLEGRECCVDELALLLGRGKRSRVGIEAFSHGGFVYSANGNSTRMDVPDEWRFVVAVPMDQERIHGTEERRRLKGMRPLDENEKNGLRSASEDILKGLREKDAPLFGKAATELDRITGRAFSPVQDGMYSNPLVEKGLEVARAAGALGGGQSSWGPGFFAVVAGEQGARNVSLALFDYITEWGQGMVFLAGARNTGARLILYE